MPDANNFSVVLGITGSIAAYKTPELVRALRALRDPEQPERRVIVRTILTAHGAEFVTPTTLQTVSGYPVYQKIFTPAAQWEVGHVGLADGADLMLIAPATANCLGKLAHGIADDLLTSVAMAVTKPLLIAPAMNVHMWDNPANQANLRILQARGVQFIGPDEGELACGYTGRGRMSSPEEIVARVKDYFLAPPPPEVTCDLDGRTVLVTAGPTREYLDPVRFLSNPSTGKMGYALAAAARDRGAKVILVSGPVNIPPPPGVTLIPVTTTEEMAAAALEAAPSADIIIGAAAPADFTPLARAEQKIKKGAQETATLEMRKTPDIIATIGAQKRPGQLLIAFAAETENLEANAAEKLARKNADFIVANDITAPNAGFATETNRATLLYPNGRQQQLPTQSKSTMAHRILDAARELLGG